MMEHLSDDQIARWILGQSTAEEERHGRACVECSARMTRFEDGVSSFRSVLREWSEREGVPSIGDTQAVFSQKPQPPQMWRWALVSIVAAVLLAIPVYEHTTSPANSVESIANGSPESTVEDDVLLMEAVSAHLSRPIPTPMERVIALLPNDDLQSGAAEETERKEIR